MHFWIPLIGGSFHRSMANRFCLPSGINNQEAEVHKSIVGGLAAMLIVFVGSVPANADRHDRHIVIVNDTTRPMIHFYASRVGLESWQEDILGPGSSGPWRDYQCQHRRWHKCMLVRSSGGVHAVVVRRDAASRRLRRLVVDNP
jgi:hypothetical protein